MVVAEIIIPFSFVIFSVGFLLLCIRCAGAGSARSPTLGVMMIDPHPASSAESDLRGLPKGMDLNAISAFPIIAYSVMKDMEAGKGLLECAVCLSKFVDRDYVRLLPKCDHAFHPECIDKWLNKHVTCPVCRTNLVPKDEKAAESSETNCTGTFHSQNSHVVISIDEADERGSTRLLTADNQAMSVRSSPSNNNNEELVSA